MSNQLLLPKWLFPRRLGAILLMIAAIAVGTQMARLAARAVGGSTRPTLARANRGAIFLPPARFHQPVPVPPVVVNPIVVERPYFVVDGKIDETFLKEAPARIDDKILRDPRSLTKP